MSLVGLGGHVILWNSKTIYVLLNILKEVVFGLIGSTWISFMYWQQPQSKNNTC